MNRKRVLIVYFSFSSQTKKLLQGLSSGLGENDIDVEWQQLNTVTNLQFPLDSYSAALKLMLTAFFRKRISIKELQPNCFTPWDLIVIAGPSWSLHPSGPILSLLDRDGTRLFRNQKVLPLISCRGFWRMHYWELRLLLKRKGAKVLSPLVFMHPQTEPWRTIGVCLKMAGKMPGSKTSWFYHCYPEYGHSHQQVNDAKAIGNILGKYIQEKRDLKNICFSIPVKISDSLFQR